MLIIALYALVISVLAGMYSSLTFSVAVISFALGWLSNMAARGLMRTEQSKPVQVVSALPRAVNISTAWRRKYWS